MIDTSCPTTLDHEWVVFSTALAEVVLLCECAQCGALGIVRDSTKEEWCRASDAPEHPYRWDEPGRVEVFRAGGESMRHIEHPNAN